MLSRLPFSVFVLLATPISAFVLSAKTEKRFATLQTVKSDISSVKTEKVKPIEPYSYTLIPSSAPPTAAPHSLIFLGPWNGTTGFFDWWLVKDFNTSQPSVRNSYRILDAVARKMPANAANQYPYKSWYEYKDWATETPVASDVDLAVAWVHGLLQQEYGVVGSYERIILGGFSQGANLALEAALRFPHKLGLVFSQRGILLADRKASSDFFVATPYILTAGEHDNVYYANVVKENAKWLRERGAPVYMKTIPGMDHHARNPLENSLVIKSFVAMLGQAPQEALQKLTDWTDCKV